MITPLLTPLQVSTGGVLSSLRPATFVLTCTADSLAAAPRTGSGPRAAAAAPTAIAAPCVTVTGLHLHRAGGGDSLRLLFAGETAPSSGGGGGGGGGGGETRVAVMDLEPASSNDAGLRAVRCRRLPFAPSLGPLLHLGPAGPGRAAGVFGRGGAYAGGVGARVSSRVRRVPKCWRPT